MDPITRHFFPEAARFPDKKSRKQAFAAAARPLRYRAFIAAFLYGPLFFAMFLILNAFVEPRWLQVAIASLLGGGIGLLGSTAMLLLTRRPMRHALRRELLALGIPICLACGYDLTGNESGVCPECGSAPESRDEPSQA